MPQTFRFSLNREFTETMINDDRDAVRAGQVKPEELAMAHTICLTACLRAFGANDAEVLEGVVKLTKYVMDLKGN